MKKEEANKIKAKGNAFFKKGNYIQAIECYTRAIGKAFTLIIVLFLAVYPKEYSYFGNRAACFLNLKK